MFKQLKGLFSTTKKPAKNHPKTLQYEELEQRVLFSADFVPGLDNIAVDEQVLVQDVTNDFPVEREAAPETVEQTAAEARRELVIVNQDVADYEQLVADLQASDNNRTIEVVVLESDRDGIEQVSQILAERSNVAAVHFITHGADGQINLGNSRLTSTILEENSDAVAGWGKALTETGEILVYGCKIAADSAGQSLMDNIAELTGADVAASKDAMGHELLGGDWDLECSSGSIKTSVALSESVQQNWVADLATATADNDTLSIGAIGETFDALAGDDIEPIPLAAERIDDHTFTLNHTNIDSTDFNYRINSFVVGDPGGDRPGSQDGIHVIMIDTTLAQYQDLVDAAEEGTHVIEYNGERESAEAVLARAVDYATNNQETINSISIMSHGLSGAFKLGNEWIGSDDLADHAEAWHALNEVMNDGGNIYLYGCNVAEDSEAGQALLDGLAEVTHADVFASDDVTGAGGDWDLEAASTGDEAELERGLDTNLDADELADYTDALADYSGAGWSGAQTFIDGAISFTLEVTGGGTIDWSYDGTTDTLTITDNDETSAATSVTITDNNGGLNVDSITTDTKLGSLTCNTDIVTLTMGKAISNTNVGGGSGTISSLIITDALQDETVNIYANISSVISTSQFWDGNFNVTGDVGSIDMTGSPGKLRDSSITVNGDLDSITVQKYEGTVSVVVTNVIGQFDMAGDYVYSNNFATETYFSFDGPSVITVNPVNDAPTTLQATTTSNGGLSLNEDGGNDAYLIADDGIGSSSLSQITYELQFNTSDLTSRLAFVSYYNSGDELSVVTEPTGELKIAVDNKLVTSSIINYESLRNGQNHTFTLAWDNAAGDWQVFIDGIIAGSGTGLAVGQTIDPGGTLIIGQEQDAEGGGFATPQRLSATLYDARFFDVVRTQEEILANYNSTLPYDEPNQIANWTFNNLSSDGVVIDTVTGNNLTVQHVSDPAFTASTPELTLAVDENATTGTVVGIISGSDADREGLIASLLAADPDLVYSATTGKFYKAINTLTYWSTAQTSAEGTLLAGVNGQLVIIRSAAENEIVWNLAKPIGDSVYIGASDQTTEGSWYWQSGGSDADQFWSGANTGTNIDGSYTNWNADQPNDLNGAEDVARLDSGDGLWYDTTITGPNQHYYAVEWDADTVLDSTQALTYSIVSQTVPGAFTVVADSGKITVADGSLLDYETAPSHSVAIQVTDSGGLSYNKTFTICIADVNEAPTAANNTVTTNEDTTFNFTAADFNFSDVDGDILASVTITSLESAGSLKLSGADVTLNQVISKADIDAGNLTFVPVADANGTGYDSFQFTVNDGTIDSAASYTMTINVTPVNDVPVIANSGTPVDFTEDGAPTVIDPTITIADVDSIDFSGGLLQVSISAGGATGDRLSIFNQGIGAGQIGVSGNDVTYGGIIIGTFTGGLNSTDPLSINLNANADITSTHALMRNITFWNTSDNPATAARTIDFSLSDGHGGTSNTISQTATVTAVADSPVAVNDHSALDFDGIDDYISIADSASLTMTNTLTMEAWIKANPSANVNRMIINKEGEYEVALFSDGTINWAFANTDPDWTWHNTGYVVPDGEWAHIAVSYDNGTVSTYVNSTLIDVYKGSGAIGDAHATLDELRIGGRSNNPAGKYFDGRIDEVRVWDTARTQVQIQTMMDQTLTGGETGLAGYWKFNEGSGTTLADSTGNGNNGTLINGGAGTAGPQWIGYSTDQNTQINITAANGIVGNDIDGDGDVLTVTQVNGSGANVGSLFTLPSGANLTVGPLGAFIYNPNGAFDSLDVGETAIDTFTYLIDDGNGGTDTATVSITITGAEDAPTAAGNTVSTNEDTTYTFSVSDFKFSDIDGDTLASVKITSLEAVGSLQLSGVDVTLNQIISKAEIDADNLKFAPVADANGTGYDSFQFTVNDGTVDSATSYTMTIDVTAVNDAPAINGDSTGAVTEDVDPDLDTLLETSGALTIADPDVGESSFQAEIVVGTYGSLTIDAAGSWSYAADNTQPAIQQLHEGESVSDVLSVTTADGTTHNVTITIHGAEDAPVAVNDNHGLDFDGIDDYVSIADNASLTMTNTVTMEAWIKADPTGNVNRMIINKEGEYEVALFPDGTINWAFANTDPDWTWHNTGYVVPDGEWTHIAVAYDNGTVSTYANGTLVDVYNGSGPIGDAHATLDELRIGGRSNDPAGKYFDGRIDDVRVWSTARTQVQIQTMMDQTLTGGETGLTGYWKFDEGSGTTVADSTGNGNNGSLIDGGAGTAGPQWTGYSTDQNTQINITAANGIVGNDIDGDGDVLTVTQVNGSGANVGSLFTLPSGANLTVGPLGAFIYNPNGAFDSLDVGETAVDTFTYLIDDGNGGTDTATVSITITGAEDAPTAAGNTVSTNEDTTYTFRASDFNFSDIDGDTLASVKITNLETVGSLQLSGGDVTLNQIISKADIDAGNLTFVPVADANGTGYDSFQFTVNDGTIDSATSYTMTIDVISVNDAPTVSLSNLTATLSEDTDTSTAIKIADIVITDDALGTNNLTLAGADAASFEIVGSELRLKAGTVLDFKTKASFDVIVQVDDVAIPGTPDDTALHTLNITDVNQAPTVSLTNLVNNLTEDTDTSSAIKIADIVITDDALGTNDLTLAGADAASFEIVGSELRLKAGTNLDFETKASFDVTVQVDDAAIAGTPEDSAAMTISITDVNESPIAVDGSISGNEDTVITGNVLSNDTDTEADPLAANLVSGPAHGSLTLSADGSFSYTPDADWNGTDSFTYTANDGALDSNVATMTITVNPVNDAPSVASSAATTATENAAYSYTVTANDIDSDGLTITASTLPAWLTIVDNGDGTATLSGTPTNTDVGEHSVELDISDGALIYLQDFTLTVSAATIDPPADDPDPDNGGSTTTDPELFENPDTDDEQDPEVKAPIHEDQPQDPVIEAEQAAPVVEDLAPQGSAHADDQLIHMQDPQINEEILYLTDDDDMDSQSEERDDDPSITYYDNDLYKDLSLSKYVNINYTAVDGSNLKSEDDLNILYLDSDDSIPVDVNDDYDLHRQQLDESFDTELKSQETKAKIVSVTAASFAAGFVSYLLRAGSLVANLMSTLPLWRGFDPIVIFSGDKKKKKKDRNDIPDTNEAKSETLFDDEVK